MTQEGYALVTGASSGIGECFARALAARGHDLVLVARSAPKLTALSRALSAAHGIRAEPMPFDLSVSGAATQLVQALRERRLEIDLLVNNAAFGARGEFWKVSLDRQSEMLRLNIQALVELTHLLLAPMVEKHRGSIINVSSTASFQPVPYTGMYGATKAFVTSLSQALAEEVRPYGVVVVTLCPGGTKTNFFQASQYGPSRFPGGLQAPEEVVEAALVALDRGSGLVVPRLLNKFTLFVQRFVPRSWVTRITAKLFRPR